MEESSSIFDELSPRLVRASQAKRLANYIIDMVVYLFFVLVLYIILEILYPGMMDEIDNGTPLVKLIDRISYQVLYALLLGSIEAIFKGKTLGKLITKTRAVNNDGSPISAKTAFLRGFARAVPFSAFSAFGNPSDPWQDRWTDTYVIEESATPEY